MTGDSQGRKDRDWPTPRTFLAPERVETWDKRAKRKAAEGINLQKSLDVESVRWKTPLAHDCKHGSPPNGQKQLEGDAQQWASPTAAAGTGGQTSRSGDRKGEALLGGQADQWATPAARDYKGPNSEEHGHHGDQLPNQVAHGTKLSKGFTGERSSPPDPATKRDGKSTTALSPYFVEALMGLPLGLTALTDSTPSATESFRSWRRAHSALLRRVSDDRS